MEALLYTERMSSVGDNLREALRVYGIRPVDLAPLLHISADAVSVQCTRDNPRLSTIARYAEAMNTILQRREDPRRFTVDSLRAGPHPEPAASPPSPDPDSLAQRVADLLRMPAGAQPLGAELLLPVWDGGMCGVAQEAGTQVGQMRVPAFAAGPGGTERNAVVLIVRGESMTGDGIEEGDQLVVRTDLDTVPPRPGDLVVVDSMVRRLDASGRRLVSLQRGHGPVAVEVGDLDTMQPQGVVVYQMRQLYRNGH